ADLMGYAANIDDATVQTYNLLTDAMDAVAQVQGSVDKTDTDVKTLGSQLSTAQAALSSAINQGTKSTQNAVGGSTQGVLVQMQLYNTALQNSLTALGTRITDVDSNLATLVGDISNV